MPHAPNSHPLLHRTIYRIIASEFSRLATLLPKLLPSITNILGQTSNTGGCGGRDGRFLTAV